jgi:hypothetical protein
VLIGTIREPPEITSRGSHVEVSKYEAEAEEDSMVATYRRRAAARWLRHARGACGGWWLVGGFSEGLPAGYCSLF